MANNISQIQVTDLDFDIIKQNLIDYFKADPTFTDYEFEGSALNILLDILAYNTHMNAIMANMSSNEMFIDSAQLRQSAISLAKLIGYTPRSIRAATALIDLTFVSVSGAPAYLTMPAGTRFSTTQGYVFSTKEQHFIYPDPGGVAGTYSKTEIEIFEGVYNDFRYTVDYSNPDQRFIIPSTQADISSLIVSVIVDSVNTQYTLNENITTLSSTSLVYFLHENPNGFFEITFGDNILGKKPINGSTVKLSYIISSAGIEANNITRFQAYQPIDGYSTYTITTNVKSYGAAAPESKEEIKLRAPKLYKAQSRAVITEDYENFMLQEYPFIDTMAIWGGEYNDPPTYGKVFIAIKPSHTEYLSDNLKAKIKSELISKYNVVTVIPEIVDPDYTYILISAEVQYDSTSNTLSELEISNIIKTDILDYFDSNTEKFNKPFYFSAMTKAILDSDHSIVSALSDIQLMKKIYPSLNLQESFDFTFGNAITPGSVRSSYYNLSGTIGASAKQKILDNGLGVLYTKNTITDEIVFSDVGNVDYATGQISLSLYVFGVPADTMDIRIYCTPGKKNIIPGFNQILLPDNSANIQDYGRTQGITIVISAENLEYK